jgi:hypothetical protein
LFVEAEHEQAMTFPSIPLLGSEQGYLFCDLLLDLGKREEVIRRASVTLEGVKRSQWTLATGLDHISLGRAYEAGSAAAEFHLQSAVECIRRSGYVDYLPAALLARATDQDLSEAYSIANRSNMLLFLADYHLIQARRLSSREHLEQADALIQQTQYHRRDNELHGLREKLRR